MISKIIRSFFKDYENTDIVLIEGIYRVYYCYDDSSDIAGEVIGDLNNLTTKNQIQIKMVKTSKLYDSIHIFRNEKKRIKLREFYKQNKLVRFVNKINITNIVEDK